MRSIFSVILAACIAGASTTAMCGSEPGTVSPAASPRVTSDAGRYLTNIVEHFLMRSDDLEQWLQAMSARTTSKLVARQGLYGLTFDRPYFSFALLDLDEEPYYRGILQLTFEPGTKVPLTDIEPLISGNFGVLPAQLHSLYSVTFAIRNESSRYSALVTLDLTDAPHRAGAMIEKIQVHRLDDSSLELDERNWMPFAGFDKELAEEKASWDEIQKKKDEANESMRRKLKSIGRDQPRELDSIR